MGKLSFISLVLYLFLALLLMYIFSSEDNFSTIFYM